MAQAVITDRYDLFSLENLYNAYRACRRHKRRTINCLRFESRLLENLCDLRRELTERSYRPSTSICFVQKKPKMREIFAADFRDRVVHHLLVGYLEPIYERIFVHDTYACRVGKGVHGGMTRLRQFLNRVTANGTRRAWYLKEDIRGFFMNMDKQILYSLICRRTRRESIRWLAGQVIFHDCTGNYTFKGQRDLLDRIPPHKTLFRVPCGKGLPIGNLTSQFFANVYLNELDQFVKRRLKCRWYLRYCDDFLLLADSRAQLCQWHEAIKAFLDSRLALALNPGQYKLRPVSSGIDFLGYVVRRKYVLVRRRVVNHLKERLNCFDGRLSSKSRDNVIAWRYSPKDVEDLRCVANSYFGHMRWANSYRLVRGLFQHHSVLRALFFIDEYKVIPRYQSDWPARNLRYQYRWWLERGLRFKEKNGEQASVLFLFKVGFFYEIYGNQALVACEVLNLKLLTGLRGFRQGCGFHRKHLGKYLSRARESGFHIALLHAQQGPDGRKHRTLVRLFKRVDIAEPSF